MYFTETINPGYHLFSTLRITGTITFDINQWLLLPYSVQRYKYWSEVVDYTSPFSMMGFVVVNNI